MRPFSWWAAFFLLCSCIWLSACRDEAPISKTPQTQITGTPVKLPYPSREILDPPWMEDRKEAQLATMPKFKVFHDFQFTDQLPESGITFVHRIVDDTGKEKKAVHYDHGNGMAIADVDQDGLLDIYFTTQLGENQLWRNLGNGQFENWTEKAGVATGDRVGVSASFADTDNDGDPDLYVTSVRGGNLFFENDGTGSFRDVTEQSGLSHTGHSSGATFFDFNRDGLLDLFLTNVGDYTTDEIGPGGYFIGDKASFGNHLFPSKSEQSILFENRGNNRFVDVSKDVGLTDNGWTGDAHALDLNEDGWPDLYVPNMQGHDEYYENQNGKRFVRRSREIFPATPWGAMGIGVFDYNHDGKMDIMITDMHVDMWDTASFEKMVPDYEKKKLRDPYKYQSAGYLDSDGEHIWGNALFRNNGEGTFTEVSDAMNAENYWPWGLSIGDLNADGYEDVFITSSMNYPFRYAVNSVLLNNLGENFLDSEFIVGVEPRRDGRSAIPWFELDCDGEDRSHPHCKTRKGKYEVWGALGSRSSAIFDLEGDGDLDIVTNDFNSEPMVLVSNLSDQKPLNYLKIKLVGNKSNRDGLGAKVTVTTDSQTLTKYYDGKSGFLSQSQYPLYFGLGDAKNVKRIEIQWPSGKTQTVAGPLKSNQQLQIKEE
ncbi:MAG: CRTAC1 family protein [Pirellulales bacterium]|jgi:hypothetical protein|nr:CRTAC1 family protein [Pirellulales bacterium]